MSDADIDRVLAGLGDGSEECRVLIGIIDHLRRVVADLRAQLEEAQRNQPGPTAPFRIPDERRASQPKKPGRKAGHPGSCRPEPDVIDETIEVPLDQCPHCHGPMTDVRAIEQTIEEIPPIRPVVTRLITYRGQCPTCGTVRTTHPLQTSTAAGAAGRLLGPRATGLAASLLHQYGL